MADKTPKVLVMDDEAGIRDILGRMLSARGAYVETAGEGSEAVEKYRKAVAEGRRFDVVILDLTVPSGMGGRETMEHLLEIDPDARGIVASGYSNDPIVSEYRKYGFSGVMSKPFIINDLYGLIISLING